MQLKASRLGIAVSLVALLALGGIAKAQTSVTGTVVSVDALASSVTIKTDDGASKTYLVPATALAPTAVRAGDRVRLETVPSATANAAPTASRLEVLGSTPPQRTVSTDRPVLGESPDAGGDRPAMPSTTGSTTGRSVSTDRPVLGQSPAASAPAPAIPEPSAAPTPAAPPAYEQTPPSTPPSPARPSADVDTDTDREDALPATASPLPFLGVMGLLALAAGLTVRATRKQRS